MIYAVPGSKVSDADLNEAKALIKSQIETAWSGQFEKDGITYTVSTQIDVSVMGLDEAFAAGESGRVMNVIAISPENAPDLFQQNLSSFVELNTGTDRTYDFGHFGLKGLRTISEAAHEFTHLLGVPNLPGPILSNTDPRERRKGNALLQAQSADFHAALGGAVDESRHSYVYAQAVAENARRALAPKSPAVNLPYRRMLRSP